MKQERFESQHAGEWQEFRDLLVAASKRSSARQERDGGRLPWLYRRVCGHYALAKHRHYSPTLVADLHDLALRGHQSLYRRQVHWLSRAATFCASEFPVTLRRHAAFFWTAFLLFIGSGVILGVLCYQRSDLIYSVMDPVSVAEMEYMYDPGNRKLGRNEEQQGESGVLMFGYYIMNNVGIGFRTFASGVLLGVGTVVVLLFNGIVIGSVAGHLTRLNYTSTFWPFVSGHGAFELTAIVICGMAGLILAHAVFSPGAMRRAHALQAAAAEAVKLVIGAALMLVVAAFIEAFWSPNPAVGAEVKYAVAALLWFVVILYLLRAGRGAPRAD